MLCPQCGHDNSNTAKFCNECGVLVDRRKGERRQGDRRQVSPRAAPREGAAARRPSPLPSLTPGQENAQGPTPARQAAEAFLRKERLPRGPEQMPVEDARESGAPMGVSGPSFLGLAGGSSGNADYLLEDEPSGAWRKWAVLLLLILVGVLGYLQWKTNWRAQPATPPPEQSAPPSTAPQGKAAPASDATGVPAPSDQQAAKPADPAQPPAGKDSAGPPSPDNPKPEDAAASDAAPKKSDPASKKKAKDADDQKDDSGEQPPAKPEPKPISQARKPAAERSTTTDSQRDPMLYMAQRYLYGQGVRHDCDQAMIYMRAANQKASASARSQMGALYATGHCVPLDRVRAYQWFTSALNLEPSNPDLQRERNNLWAQMSSSERQQAVK